VATDTLVSQQVDGCSEALAKMWT